MFDTQSFEPEITIDIHPTAATDKATDQNPETIAQFRERLGLSEDAYSKLRKRAIRRWKAMDWQPVRTGSNVNYIVNPDQLEQLHREETEKASSQLANREESDSDMGLDLSGKTRKMPKSKTFQPPTIPFIGIIELQAASQDAQQQTEDTFAGIGSLLSQFAEFKVREGLARINAEVDVMVNQAVNQAANNATQKGKK